MEEKTYSVVLRHRIYTIASWLGVVIAVVGYFLTGIWHDLMPWIGMAMVILAIVFRFTMVKCPHCGHLLTESKSIPVKCPKCDKELR